MPRRKKKVYMGADGKKSPIPSGWRPWMSGDVRLKENPDTDFFLQTKEDYGQTIFDKLLRARRDRKYGYSGDAAKYLQNIVDEIKLHTKITALSIFGIGELLFEAKRLIAKKTVKGTFQDWIGENFDFSYDSAQNFMHVFECCFGRRQLLEGVKPTMLYKVSEPSFPEELRNALLSNGAEALRKLTNRDVDKLAKQYETEGWDGIAGTVEQVCDVYVDMQEIQYGFSLLYQICRDLETRKAQLNKHLSGRSRSFVPSKSQSESTNKIHEGIFKAIDNAVEVLDLARFNCQQEFGRLQEGSQKNLAEILGPKLPEPETEAEAAKESPKRKK